MTVTLYADSREKRSGIAIRLRQLGLTVRTRQLPVGDYALPGKFVVERKEANDFATSIMSGHLFQQAELLAGHRLPGTADAYLRRNPQLVKTACEAIAKMFEVAANVNATT